MTTHPVMTPICVNMHLGLDKERHMNFRQLSLLIIKALGFRLSHRLEKKWDHPLESFGQAGSCVFLVFLFKNQVLSLFKLNLNMTMHPVMTLIGVNMHQSPI